MLGGLLRDHLGAVAPVEQLDTAVGRDETGVALEQLDRRSQLAVGAIEGDEDVPARRVGYRNEPSRHIQHRGSDPLARAGDDLSLIHI